MLSQRLIQILHRKPFTLLSSNIQANFRVTFRLSYVGWNGIMEKYHKNHGTRWHYKYCLKIYTMLMGEYYTRLLSATAEFFYISRIFPLR